MKKINLTKLLKSIIFCFYIVALAWVIFSLIWVPLDFTLTMLCWMGLFGIFDGLWNLFDQFRIYKNLGMMESVIKWQTGMPEQSDIYIVTTTAGEVDIRVLYDPYTSPPYWLDDEEDDEVVAWCKLSDIEPYKE